MQTKATFKYAALGLKIAIFSAVLWYIFSKVGKHAQLEELGSQWQETFDKRSSLLLLLLVLLLMPINWAFEAIKWKKLVSGIQNVSFRRAYCAILAGTSVSLVTPNRTGEFIGRILFLDRDARVRGSYATFFGSLAQLITTLMVGLLCFLAFYFLGNRLDVVGSDLVAVSLSVIAVLAFILVYFYTSPRHLAGKLLRLKFLQRYTQQAAIIGEFGGRLIAEVMAISIARYCIFAFQFYALIILFGVDVQFYPAMLLIGMTYLIMTLVPAAWLGKIGVREAVALFVFGSFVPDTTGILLASLSLWLVNVIAPAILGSLFLLKSSLRA